MSDRFSKMPLATEMRGAISLLAGERAWNETRERWLDRAARRANISYRQAKSLFYGEGNPRSELVDRVRETVRNRRRQDCIEAKDAYRQLIESIERAQTALRVRDQDFHGPEIDALREILSGVVSPVDQGEVK